jgi:orotidine-5'-phosphate decarboxylase
LAYFLFKLNIGEATMKDGTFVDRLQAAMLAQQSILCVGFDPQMKFMPPHLIEEGIRLYGKTFQAQAWIFSEFNRAILSAVAPSVCMVKPQAAFYEASHFSWEALEVFTADARGRGILVDKDAKRGDGSETADYYAQAHIGKVDLFGEMVEAPIRTDALTIHAYIGDDCVSRFVREVMAYGTGVFVVDKTSFRPNSAIEMAKLESGLTVWEEMAFNVSRWGQGTEGKNGYSNIGVVMGATYPTDAVRMREILPNVVMLKPGLGKQGGSADEAVVGVNDDGFGVVVNDSRRILMAWMEGPYACPDYPDRFAEASGKMAADARDNLNEALRRAGKCPF